MDVKFSNFGSIYEILAGISSALVIFDFTRRYIMQFLRKVLIEQSKEINNHIDFMNERMLRIEALSYSDEEGKWTGLGNEAKKVLAALRVHKKRLSVPHETLVIASKLEAFLWANFFYCIVVLATGGLDESGFFKNDYRAFEITGTITVFLWLLNLGNLFRDFIFRRDWEVTKWYLGLRNILLSLAFARLYYIFQIPIGMKILGKEIVLTATFVTALLPFIAIVARIPYFLYWLLPKEKSEINKLVHKSKEISDKMEIS